MAMRQFSGEDLFKRLVSALALLAQELELEIADLIKTT